MCKNLRNMAFVEPKSVLEEVIDIRPVMDDTSAFETLCPVNSVTGHRGNPLDALDMVLKPEKARLLNEVLQEIPPSGVPSDVGTFELLADRLSCGTDSERAIYLKKLEGIASDIYNIRPDLKPKDNIDFLDDDKKISDD